MILEPLIIISATYCNFLECCEFGYLRGTYEPASRTIYICEQVKDKKSVGMNLW